MEQIPQEIISGTPKLFDLTDKTAVITGGSRGLGRGMALALAACGVDVAVVSRGMPDLEVVVGEIGNLGRKGLAVTVDVTDEKDVEKMVETVVTDDRLANLGINTRSDLAMAGSIAREKILKKLVICNTPTGFNFYYKAFFVIESISLKGFF